MKNITRWITLIVAILFWGATITGYVYYEKAADDVTKTNNQLLDLQAHGGKPHNAHSFILGQTDSTQYNIYIEAGKNKGTYPHAQLLIKNDHEFMFGTAEGKIITIKMGESKVIATPEVVQTAEGLSKQIQILEAKKKVLAVMLVLATPFCLVLIGVLVLLPRSNEDEYLQDRADPEDV